MLKTNSRLADNGFSIEEEEKIYEEQLQEVFDNPRWYLDNLDYMVEYRVRWVDYKKGNNITLPRKFSNLDKKEKGL